MIFEGQVYKLTDNHITHLEEGKLIQIVNVKHLKKIECFYYKSCHIKNFEYQKVTLSSDQIKCYCELIYDLRKLLV